MSRNQNQRRSGARMNQQQRQEEVAKATEDKTEVGQVPAQKVQEIQGELDESVTAPGTAAKQEEAPAPEVKPEAISIATTTPLTQKPEVEKPAAVRVQPPQPAKRNTATIGRLSTSAPLAVEKRTDFQLELAKSMGTLSPNAKNLVNQLEKYLNDMRPRMPIQPAQGVANQEALLNSIIFVVKNTVGEEFTKCWNILLGYFADGQELKNAFYRRYSFRFLDSDGWRLTEDRIRSFEYLLDMLHQTAEAETRRKHFENLDLDKTLKIFSEDERAKIVAFYTSK